MNKIFLVVLLVLIGCTPTTVVQKIPTPFNLSVTTVKMYGCVELHKEVDLWNKNNPDKEPRIADC